MLCRKMRESRAKSVWGKAKFDGVDLRRIERAGSHLANSLGMSASASTSTQREEIKVSFQPLFNSASLQPADSLFHRTQTSLRAHNESFDQLLRLIPAKYYIHQEDTPKPSVRSPL